MDDAPLTVIHLLRRSAAEHKDRTALLCEGDPITYADLGSRITAAAGNLVAHGLVKGMRVGLLAPNSADWIAAALAVVSCGGVLVPLSTFNRGAEQAYALRHADVAMLIATTDLFLGRDLLAELAEHVPALATVDRGLPLYLTDLPALRTIVPLAALQAESAVPGELVTALGDDVDPDDDCYILFTSGSTADPKGVLHTHEAIASNGWRIGERQHVSAGDVVWFYFPFFFAAGCINVLLGSLSHGATLIVQDRFDPEIALTAIAEHRANVWHLWPHMLTSLKESPSWTTLDHSSLHKGTGPYDLMAGLAATDGLGGVNMYGLTETCTAIACADAADPPELRARTAGLPLPGAEIRIADPDTGTVLAPGERGEVCVRGPGVFRRYYKAGGQASHDPDGWFHTGDLGELRPDGRLVFHRRLKDTIKVGGINVSPADVERTLGTIGGVRDAYAFGIPDGDRGESVAAVLVPRPGEQVDAEVAADVVRSLARHKRPTLLVTVDLADIPMTPSGKVILRRLREQALASDPATHLTPQGASS